MGWYSMTNFPFQKYSANTAKIFRNAEAFLPLRFVGCCLFLLCLMYFFSGRVWSVVFALILLVTVTTVLLASLFSNFRRTHKKYFITALVVGILAFPISPIARTISNIRFYIELKLRQSSFEADIARIQQDKDGRRSHEWDPVSGQGFAFFYYDDSLPLLPLSPAKNDPCNKYYSKLSGNFFHGQDSCR